MPLLWGPYGSNVPAIGDYKGRKIYQAHEARTNYFTQSGVYTHTDWAKINCDPVIDSITPPNSQFQAYKMRATSADAGHAFRQSYTTDGVSRYCISSIVHNGEYDWCALKLWGAAFVGNPFVWFNIREGLIGSYAAPGIDLVNLFPLGYGWWNVFMSATSDAVGNGYPEIDFAPEDMEEYAYTYPGDGTSGIYCCHAQFEKSPNGRPSPPIVTGASAVSTNNDNMVFGPSDFDYELFKKKYGFIWVPNWSSTSPYDLNIMYFLGTDTNNFIRLIRSNNLIYHNHQIGGGGVINDVQMTLPTFPHQQKMLFLVDPEEGSIEVVGAQSGGAKVTGTPWADLVLPTYSLNVGAGGLNGQWPIDGSITNFFRI